jgi:AraC-like DNA-binding protein
VRGESLLVEEISRWEECLRRARAIEREVRKARRRIERCPNLRKAYRVVEGCFGTTISVRQGAEYASLSKTAFEQRFAKVVGLSFHRFLVLDGLSRAIGLLESGDDPVTSVALEAGFTLGSLEYNFRRHLACCSPSAYRKAHRSQPRRGAIVGRIEPRVAAGRPDRAARTEAEDASRVVARRALAADPNPITPNAAGPFVPPAAVSDLPELLCRICSERRLLPEESCAVCPFRSAPATAPSAERTGEPSGDPFPSPPDPVNPVEPAADPAQAQSRLERAILGGTLVEIIPL